MARADQRRVPSLAVYSKASDTWGRGRGHPCLAPKLVEQSQMQASRRVARLVLQNRSSSHDSRNKKLGTMIGKESRLGVCRSWNPHGKEVNVASLVRRKQEQRQQIQTEHRCPCPKGNGVLLPLLQQRQQQEGGWRCSWAGQKGKSDSQGDGISWAWKACFCLVIWTKTACVL